jgi:hypothetical protein
MAGVLWAKPGQRSSRAEPVFSRAGVRWTMNLVNALERHERAAERFTALIASLGTGGTSLPGFKWTAAETGARSGSTRATGQSGTAPCGPLPGTPALTP